MAFWDYLSRTSVVRTLAKEGYHDGTSRHTTAHQTDCWPITTTRTVARSWFLPLRDHHPCPGWLRRARWSAHVLRRVGRERSYDCLCPSLPDCPHANPQGHRAVSLTTL